MRRRRTAAWQGLGNQWKKPKKITSAGTKERNCLSHTTYNWVVILLDHACLLRCKQCRRDTEMRAEWFELPTFWSGVRRAAVAPYPRYHQRESVCYNFTQTTHRNEVRSFTISNILFRNPAAVFERSTAALQKMLSAQRENKKQVSSNRTAE